MAQNAQSQAQPSVTDVLAGVLSLNGLSLQDARHQQAQIVAQLSAIAVQMSSMLDADQGDNLGSHLKVRVEAWQSLEQKGVSLGSVDESLVLVSLRDLRKFLLDMLQILEPVKDRTPDFSVKEGNA